jgi:hypothetical protein
MRKAKAREKLRDTLQSISTGDPEGAHLTAESAILDFLKDIGEAQAKEQYEAVKERCGFWYA